MKEEKEITPLRTILQNFLNHVESLDRPCDDSYDKEFQSLKIFSETLKVSKQYSCTEGEKEVNKKKNRYKDILPFDYTRVILSAIPGVQGSDYVNANYIKGASGSLAYIASQGPLSHTANDFWRMVVECEVQVIVMACNEEESGKHKCEHYWTDHEGEEKQFGMATIRLIKASVVCPDFLVRTMQLRYKKDNTTIERKVCQFHYSAWPDHGVPPLVRPLLDMVRLVRDTQASETLPVLIHCSAGCGRTGTICAIDYVWGLLRAGKLTRDFSLLKLVRDMRKQRIAMVQTKDQYVLVHKAVRELFQEQLKMIDAHPYENVDLNGIPLLKEEPTYERVREAEMDEKQDNKEKESTSHCNPLCDSLKESKVLIVDIPPLPLKKSCSHVAPSKHEKEVENQTQKQLSSISTWSTNFEVTKCNPHYHIPSPSVGYSSTGDSGLSASSTDSSSTITSEKLPKRCPLPLPLVESMASSSSLEQSIVASLALNQDDSSSSSSPSISSLLHKPRIAKLKALFERHPTSKVSKSRSVKPFDETDFVTETPKVRPAQQVTRSHSLGAVRKPNKFSQFQTASETPVALCRKLFSTKENKETNLVIKKGHQTETFKAITKENKDVNSSSSSSIGSIANSKNDPLCTRNTKLVLDDKPSHPHLKETACAMQSSSGSQFQNIYHPTPRQEHKPLLPVKRSKSLKVVGNVDHSYFSTTQNYVMPPSQFKEAKTCVKQHQQQMCVAVGEEEIQPKVVPRNSDVGAPQLELHDKPTPRERQKRNLDTRLVGCTPSYQSASSKGLQSCSKIQAARLSSLPVHQDYAHLNGSAHHVTEHLDGPSNNYQMLHNIQSEAGHSSISEFTPHPNLRNKEYVNISELKSNWHQAGLETTMPPPPTKSSSRLQETSHKQFSKQLSGENSRERGSTTEQKQHTDHSNTTLDANTQKIIDDCHKYLQISLDSHDIVSSPKDIPEEELLQSEQYDSLSAEAQKKINNIVGGIGIRERRNSFRKAVCHEGDSAHRVAQRVGNIKDYEPIWLQSDGRKGNVQIVPEHWMLTIRPSEICGAKAFPNHDSGSRIGTIPQNAFNACAIQSNIDTFNTCAIQNNVDNLLLNSPRVNNNTKRPPEIDSSKFKATTHNPTYHAVHTPSAWESADPCNVPGVCTTRSESAVRQSQQLQQRAVTKTVSTRFPANSKKPPPLNLQIETCKVESVQPETCVTTNCVPGFKREISSLETHGGSQTRGTVATSGPLAPPRVKRHAIMTNIQQRNSMFESSDLLRSDAVSSSNPVYVNTDNLKSVSDRWHGAPGIDVDTVAASIKKTQNDSSTPLTRAFEKLHSKASNLRTKLSTRSDSDGLLTANLPDPDTRQQGRVAVKSSKSPQMQGVHLTPHAKKQQQYL